jgi:hypothetical protein
MSNAATVRVPLTTLDDDAWDDLLSFIEERRVNPIVGPEHLQVSTERGPRLLYDWLAETLAVRLNVDVAALPHPPHRTALLNEAARLIGRVPSEMGKLHSLRFWRDLVSDEQHRHAAAMTRPAAVPGPV